MADPNQVPSGVTFGDPGQTASQAASQASPIQSQPNSPNPPEGVTFGDASTPPQEQSFWDKIKHGGEASAPGQVEQFEQYKKDRWKNIINYVESGNLHGAAGEFLNLFQNPHGGGTASEIGTGALKSAGQTVNTVSDAISRVLPSVVRPEDVQQLKGAETLNGPGEQIGAGLETLAEFMMGDEALKGLEGLTRTEKLAKLMPHMKMLENSPKLMKATKALYNISKMSGLTAGVSAAHPEEGQTRTQAAQGGAIGGALFGAGGEALSTAAESTIPALKNAIEGALRPTTETVGNTEVPVRNPSFLGETAQKTVPDIMSQFAKERTGPAVAKGIGEVAKEAAGTEGVVSPDQYDRLGIRGVADEVKGRSQEVFKKLDEVSGNMLSEAQQMADDASGDYSSAGRKEYRQAMDMQDAIFENYKNHSEMKGMDLDQAKEDWRKQVALRDISKKLTGATESSETGNQDYQLKQGKQLAESVDSLVKNDKDVLQRAGFSDDHIDQLQNFGRIVREQAETPKFSNYMSGIAKTLSGAIGFHEGGWAGAMGGTAMEMAAERVGRVLANRMLGKVLTTPEALPILSNGLKNNVNPAIVTNQLKSVIAKTDPTWAAKMGETLSNLWHDESGQLNIPGAQTVGTAEGAKADTEYFANAKKELGDDASISDVAKRAQEMKTQANLSGPGAEGAGSVEAINRANTEKAQGVKRVVVDTRSGQERPLTGVDAVDYQAKPYESVEFRGGNRDGEIIDQGKSARPYQRKYSGEERRGTERKTMNATELDAAMKLRKPINTPFNDTEGAMQTIARDPNMPKYPGEKSEVTALSSANDYQRLQGKPDVSPSEPTANPNGPAIADAYGKMQHDPSDPAVKQSYDALKSEVDQQWDHAQQSGIKFEPWAKEGQPYANSKEMMEDVAKNKHLYFFQGGDLPADHPMGEIDPKTGLTFNDKFRAVHDLYGHAAHGYQFGPAGEDAAYRAHSQMFSPEAKPALTTETRGQNSWVNYGPHMRDAEGNMLAKGDKGYLSPSMRPFAEQKAGILPEAATPGPFDALKQKYGTTDDVLKAGFILPEGDMIPLVGEHDHMLGGKTTENTREQFIRDTGAIRSRYRMSRAGEEQVFSLPAEITEGQARQIRYAADKLKNGRIVLETVDGKNHQSLDFPTGAKTQTALENLVNIKSDETPGTNTESGRVGQRKPTDWQSDIGAHEEDQQPANATGISRTGLSQEESQTQPRGRSRTSGAVSTSGNRANIENVYKAVTGKQ